MKKLTKILGTVLVLSVLLGMMSCAQTTGGSFLTLADGTYKVVSSTSGEITLPSTSSAYYTITNGDWHDSLFDKIVTVTRKGNHYKIEGMTITIPGYEPFDLEGEIISSTSFTQYQNAEKTIYSTYEKQ